jgi:hypothetical protein
MEESTIPYHVDFVDLAKANADLVDKVYTEGIYGEIARTI